MLNLKQNRWKRFSFLLILIIWFSCAKAKRRCSFEWEFKNSHIIQNWGDSICGQRLYGQDLLLYRDLYINYKILNSTQNIALKRPFTNEATLNITTVRAINIGQQKAKVQSIEIIEPLEVVINLSIKSDDQVRLLWEIYGNTI